MMTLRYDTDSDALDITLAEGIVVRTEELDEGMFVDVDQDGRPLSIEILSPGRKWPLDALLARFDEIDPADVELLRSIRGASVRLSVSAGPLVLA